MEKDFCIEYNIGFPAPFQGFIDFCGLGVNNRFVFLEMMPEGNTNTIFVDKNGMTQKENRLKDIYALNETSDGVIYYFCMNPLRIVVDYGERCDEIQLQEEKRKYYPLSLNVFGEKIIITLYPARIVVFSRNSHKKTLDLDLTVLKIKYPLYAEPYSSNSFLITDSKNNMVHIVDSSLNIIWEYGKRDAHGIDDGLLFAPQRATSIQGDKFLISLRRGHCILIVNKDKHVERIFGIPFSVGGDGQSLWLPQALYIGNDLYAIMCESAHIAIVKYDSQSEKWCKFYSMCPIKISQLCQPRSCDYSSDHEMLLIADTEHDRVLGYDLDGNLKLLIDDKIIPDFDSPRCCIFHENNLFITSSQKRSIYYTSIFGEVIDHYVFDQTLANSQWLQSIDYLNGNLLVAFERVVVLLDWQQKQIIWSTQDNGTSLDDVHYAQYLDEFCYLISDNGNNRAVFINGDNIYYISDIYENDETIKLSAPRFAKIIDGRMYIISTQAAQAQILVCDPKTLKIISVFGGIKGLGDNRLSMPRWICKGPENSIFISDTGNHRIILRNI